MGKPTAAAIRSAESLTQEAKRFTNERTSICEVCGVAVDPADLPLTVWREHDERDRPIAGTGAIVFLGQGREHAACRKKLDDHPRLYSEESGAPGHFPALCGPCVHRDGLACRHPDLYANGGTGLRITLTRLAAVICTRGAGCHSPIQQAVACEGREVSKGVR